MMSYSVLANTGLNLHRPTKAQKYLPSEFIFIPPISFQQVVASEAKKQYCMDPVNISEN
jgi:hypothetical protein